MHVSAGRAVRCVDVGVRVDPDQTNLLVLTPVELGNSGDSARPNGMVAAQNQRNLASLQSLQHQFRMLGAGRGDFLQIFCMGVARFFLFGDRHRNIARILDDMT